MIGQTKLSVSADISDLSKKLNDIQHDLNQKCLAMKDEVSQQIFLKETVGRSLSENQRHLDKSLLEHEGRMIKEMASKETAMTWKFFGSVSFVFTFAPSF